MKMKKKKFQKNIFPLDNIHEQFPADCRLKKTILKKSDFPEQKARKIISQKSLHSCIMQRVIVYYNNVCTDMRRSLLAIAI